MTKVYPFNSNHELKFILDYKFPKIKGILGYFKRSILRSNVKYRFSGIYDLRDKDNKYILFIDDVGGKWSLLTYNFNTENEILHVDDIIDDEISEFPSFLTKKKKEMNTKQINITIEDYGFGNKTHISKYLKCLKEKYTLATLKIQILSDKEVSDSDHLSYFNYFDKTPMSDKSNLNALTYFI